LCDVTDSNLTSGAKQSWFDMTGPSDSSSESTIDSASSEGFKEQVTNLIANPPLTTRDLEHRAKNLIKNLKDSPTYNSLPQGHSDPKLRSKVQLHRTLESMLEWAPICGGDEGKLYTLCAIYNCGQSGEMQTLPLLQSLATTWLSHFLFVCTCHHVLLSYV
jgi:hypothetical protein